MAAPICTATAIRSGSPNTGLVAAGGVGTALLEVNPGTVVGASWHESVLVSAGDATETVGCAAAW